jgi:hypothetical protein
MRCTNYSLPLYDLLSKVYNTAAADYIAAIMESDHFQQWYGKTEIPDIMETPFLKNQAGQEWNMVETIDNWVKQQEYAAGFRDSSGERIKYGVDEPGVQDKLAKMASSFNLQATPFHARPVRLGDEYVIMLGFDASYKKKNERAMIAAAPQGRRETESLFYFNNIDPKVLHSGKRNLSIRPDFCKEGIYQLGKSFYRVSLKYQKPIMVRDVKEKISELKDRLIQDEDAIEFKYTKDFFAARAPMFIYDVVKVDMDETKAKAMPDFVGLMAIKPQKRAKGQKLLTGYADVDKYLKALTESKEALYRQRTAVKADLAKVQEIDAQLDVIKTQIDRLHKEAKIDTITAVGRTLLGQLRKDMDKSFTFDQMQEALRIAKAWMDIDKVIDFAPVNPDEEELEILEEAKEVRDMAKTLYQVYFNKFRDKALDLVDEKLGFDEKGNPRSMNLVDDEGEIRILDIDKAGSMGIGISFSANELEQLTADLIEKSEMKALDEDYEFNKGLENAVIDLTGKGYKHTKASDFNFMFTKDSNGNSALVTKVNRDFYKEVYINRYKAFDKRKMSKNRSENYMNAIALGATAAELKGDMTPKEYYDFERAKFDYELTESGKMEWERYMEVQREAHIIGYDEANEPIYDKINLEKIQAEYDPQNFSDFLEGKSKHPKSGARWFTKMVKPGIAESEEFKKMDDKQKAFYNYFVDQFIKGQQDTVVDYRFSQSDIDKAVLQFVIGKPGSTKDKAAYATKKTGKFLESIAGVRYYEDENVKLPSRAITGVEHLGVEFKKVGEFIPDPNSITKANPVEILKSFRLAGHMFKQRRQIEDQLNAIRDLAINANKLERTADGRAKRDIVGKIFTSKHKTNVADRIEYNVKVAMTGKRKEEYSTLSQSTKPGEFKFSIGKTVDSINNYTRFKAMALSPLSATGNFIMGSVNNFIYSAGNQYFTDKELAHGYWLIKTAIPRYFSNNYLGDKNAAKIAELLMRYNVIGDVTEKLYHEGDFLSWFFTWQKGGEFLNQGASTIAQMLNTKIELADGTKKTVWDMFELGKDKKLVFRSDLLAEDSEWNNPERVHTFFMKARKVNQKIHGDYHNPLMVKKDVIGRVFMLFRTWLPMAIKERFGGTYHDYLLGEQRGRYRSLVGKGVINPFKEALAHHDIKELGTFAKTMAKIFLPFIGRKIKLGNLSETDQANINMAVREIHFLLMLTLACMSLKAAVDDDDEDPIADKNILRYLYNQGERAQSELEFFFSPKDEMQILRDIIPLYSTFRDGYRVMNRSWTYLTDPEEDEYKRGFRKGNSKAGTAWQEFLPVLRSVQKTWSASEQIFSDTRYQ